MRAVIDGKAVEFDKGTPWRALVKQPGALGVSVGGSTLSLNAPAQRRRAGARAHLCRRGGPAHLRAHAGTDVPRRGAKGHPRSPRAFRAFVRRRHLRAPAQDHGDARAWPRASSARCATWRKRISPLPTRSAPRRRPTPTSPPPGRRTSCACSSTASSTLSTSTSWRASRSTFYGEMAPSTGCASVFQLQALPAGAVAALAGSGDGRAAHGAVCGHAQIDAHLWRDGAHERRARLRKRRRLERDDRAPRLPRLHPRQRGHPRAQH